MEAFLEHFDRVLERQRPVALATVVGIEGGSSKRVGARMWVTEDAETFGSLTVGGCVDGRARDEAFYVLKEGPSRRVRIDLGEDGLDFGMSCAGTVDVFIQRVDVGSPVLDALKEIRSATAAGQKAVLATPLDDRAVAHAVTEASVDTSAAPVSSRAVLHAPEVLALLDEDETESRCVTGHGDGPDVLYQSFVPPRLLVVVGAAPIAEPLVSLGKMLGFRVVLVDGKNERLEGERFSEADERLTGIPSEICGRLDLDARSAVVLTAHDYRYEVPVLKEVLQHPAGYVGFVASRRRGDAVLDFLAGSGLDRETLDRVHVPVGLDIGALTPAEIAVSIMSEITAVRTGATCLPLVDLRDPRGEQETDDGERNSGGDGEQHSGSGDGKDHSAGEGEPHSALHPDADEERDRTAAAESVFSELQ